MEFMIIYILIANFIVSLGGLLGVITLIVKQATLNKWLKALVALSAGAMLANALLHLLPEAAEQLPAESLFPGLLLAFVFFFILEKLIHWRHCHQQDCDTHSFGYMNLVGDAIHNFIDGLLIAAAFQTNYYLGVSTTIAVALHEIPQEISDFGVLLYAGMKPKTALLANFGVALMSVLGGIVGFLALEKVEFLVPYLLVVAAGSFLYIAASDLMPELRNNTRLQDLLVNAVLFIVGIILIALLQAENGEHSQGMKPSNQTTLGLSAYSARLTG